MGKLSEAGEVTISLEIISSKGFQRVAFCAAAIETICEKASEGIVINGQSVCNSWCFTVWFTVWLYRLVYRLALPPGLAVCLYRMWQLVDE